MTDLRKAAEMALEAFDYHFDNEDDYLNWEHPLVLEAKQALRQALAESECCNHDCNEGRDCPFKKEKK